MIFILIARLATGVASNLIGADEKKRMNIIALSQDDAM
jgi:hypothetical protein